MLRFFLDNKLITTSQSGFKPGDSCINQLLSITHEIYKSFDGGLEVRSVFLDISKAFDKVWHEGVIFKLEQNGISGDLLNILRDFLSNRVLNGQVSTRTSVNAGVVKALDSQSRGPVLKTAGWLQGRLSLSSSRGR